MNGCLFVAQPLEVVSPELVIFTLPLRPTTIADAHAAEAICQVVPASDGVRSIWGSIEAALNPAGLLECFEWEHQLNMELWLFEYLTRYVASEAAADRASQITKHLYEIAA